MELNELKKYLDSLKAGTTQLLKQAEEQLPQLNDLISRRIGALDVIDMLIAKCNEQEQEGKAEAPAELVKEVKK